MQVLALIDDATQEQRLTLWAIDVLKYGEPFSTPLRQFYLPSTSQADATKQALGVVVAIGSHPAPAVPHTAVPHTVVRVLILLYMCPHTAAREFSSQGMPHTLLD